MFKNTVTTTVSGGGANKIKADMMQLVGLEVFIGIPKDTSARKKTSKISNAELLYIHTHGSPLQNIPARPVIEPAIKANQDLINKELAKVVPLAIDGQISEAKKQLKKVGVLGANLARAWFTDSRNNWKENAPSTIKRKGSNKPLIDTGELRKAITFVIK
jgi:hypothetical protein